MQSLAAYIRCIRLEDEDRSALTAIFFFGGFEGVASRFHGGLGCIRTRNAMASEAIRRKRADDGVRRAMEAAASLAESFVIENRPLAEPVPVDPMPDSVWDRFLQEVADVRRSILISCRFAESRPGELTIDGGPR